MSDKRNNIRPCALQWFRDNIGETQGIPIACSKYYRKEESWPKREVWFLQPSKRKVERAELHGDDVHFLCQTSPTSESFHHLRVPANFLIKNINKLVVKSSQNGGIIQLYLLPDEDQMFHEIRATIEGPKLKRGIDFSKFVVPQE